MTIYDENIRQIQSYQAQDKSNFIRMIKVREPKLYQWINDEFEKHYPNAEQPMIGKIWLLLHPDEPLYCEYGSKKHYLNKRYVCNHKCQCVWDQIKKTNFDETGYENPFSNPKVIKDFRQKNVRVYGFEFPIQNPVIKEKSDNKNLELYGFASATKNQEVKDRTRKTCLAEYGGYPMQNKEVRARSTKTILEECGVAHISQRNLSYEVINILYDKNAFAKMLQTRSVSGMAKELGVVDSTIRYYHKLYELNLISSGTSSWQENELTCFLNENNIKFKQRDRKQIKPYELDFYFSEKNIAIEFNGVYWHMKPELFEKDHKIRNGKIAQDIWDHDDMKKKMCEEKGIELITIWEDEWEESKEEIKKTLIQKLS